MHFHGKFYGATTIGKRGQIVIPAKARQDLNLKEGNRLLVFSRFGRFLGLIKSEEMDNFIEKITTKMSKGIERFKKYGKNYRS